MKKPRAVKFSVCIITNAGLSAHRHRCAYLSRLIASLQGAGFTPENSEVIVSGAVPEGLTCTRALPLAELAATGQVCALRNHAIKEARGEWIVQCDDDIIFAPGYVAALGKSLAEDAACICTRLLNPNGSRYWDWAAFVPGKGQTLLPYDTQNPLVYATGGHGIYRRTIFETIRWPESIRHGQNEEYEMADLFRKNGLQFRMCAAATVWLQYHHCDALAAINGTGQRTTEKPSQEFNALMDQITPSKPPFGALEKEAMRNRIGFKFSPNLSSESSTVDVSILTCCSRYMQRFRIFAQSICRQNYDLSKVEVLVANPHSPDGLSTFISLLKTAAPSPIFEDVIVDATHYRNRGFLIQRTFERARGQIVIGMDCDVVLPPDFPILRG